MFGELIGARGVYAVTPRNRFVWGGYYEGETLIWRSRWTTAAGIVACREALAFPGDEHRLVLLRRIEPLDCDAELDLVLDPHADYGSGAARNAHCAKGIWLADLGPLRLRWRGAPTASFDRHRGWSGSLAVARAANGTTWCWS